MKKPWPRLTTTFRLLVVWGHCQRCHKLLKPPSDAQIWREHDDADEPEPRAVVLCRKCAELIIEKHPRLYSREQADAPIPGVMELCGGCVHWHAYSCTHPHLKLNGGEGLMITFPEPFAAFVCKGGGKGGLMKRWWGPPTKCAGQALTS